MAFHDVVKGDAHDIHQPVSSSASRKSTLLTTLWVARSGEWSDEMSGGWSDERSGGWKAEM